MRHTDILPVPSPSPPPSCPSPFSFPSLRPSFAITYRLPCHVPSCCHYWVSYFSLPLFGRGKRARARKKCVMCSNRRSKMRPCPPVHQHAMPCTGMQCRSKAQRKRAGQQLPHKPARQGSNVMPNESVPSGPRHPPKW